MENVLHNGAEGTVTRQKLIEDLRVLLQDAEDLVRATAGTVAEKSRGELTAALDRLRSSSRRIEEKAMNGAEATDALIREYPYQSLGVAFGVGLLIGVLTRR